MPGGRDVRSATKRGIASREILWGYLYVADLRALVGSRPLILAGAAVLIVDAGGRLLLLHRSDSDTWGLPGGYLEAGESLEECARCEAYEETGLSVGQMRLLGVFSGRKLFYQYPHGLALSTRCIGGSSMNCPAADPAVTPVKPVVRTSSAGQIGGAALDLMSTDFATVNLAEFMRDALAEAEVAGREGELPVGAVIVIDGEVVSRGRAQHRSAQSQVRHAELNAILALPDKSKEAGRIVETIPYVRGHIKSYQGGILADESAALFARYGKALR